MVTDVPYLNKITYFACYIANYIFKAMTVETHDISNYTAIDVSPAIDKGVCVPKLPFFINRIKRDLQSSETVKVHIYTASVSLNYKLVYTSI